MKRYIRSLICLLYSFLKFYFLKLFHFKTFLFTNFNLVSPFTEIEIEKKGTLILKKMIRIRSGSKIKVRNGGKVVIGKNTSLNHGCMIISRESISIGEDTQIGPNVLIYDHDHKFKKEHELKNLLFETSPVTIGKNVWIGANVVILRGTDIGDNCVIGAGSIIKGDFPANSLIVQKRETTVKEFRQIN